MSEDHFAYGENCVNGVECPASKAGFPPGEQENRGYSRVADQFDTLVRMELYDGDYSELSDPPDLNLRKKRPLLEEGTIHEELAEEIWMKAIEAQDETKSVEAGKRVANELGWG